MTLSFQGPVEITGTLNVPRGSLAHLEILLAAHPGAKLTHDLGMRPHEWAHDSRRGCFCVADSVFLEFLGTDLSGETLVKILKRNGAK